MGRKSISPKTRSIPVSFSVKPQLADRIENLAYDQRFTRSKFLQEAVLRYINFIEMKDSPMLHDMSAEQRVVIGANALQEAIRDGDEIRPSIIAHLKKQLEVFEMKNFIKEIDYNVAEAKKIFSDSINSDIVFEKVPNQSEYQIFNNGTNVGTIYKDLDLVGKIWVVKQGNDINTHRTLKEAKAAVLEEWE